MTKSFETRTEVDIPITVREPREPMAPNSSSVTEHATVDEAIFEQVPFGVALFDGELRYQRINSYAAAFVDQKPEALIGKPLRDVMYNSAGMAVAEDIIAKFQHVLLTGEHLVMREWSLVPLDAARESRYADWEIRRVGMSDGAYGILLAFIDVTRHVLAREALQKAKEALRQSRESFAKVFRSSPAIMVISSLDEGRYLDVNDSFVSIIGYSREEAVGHTATELGIWVHPELRMDVVRDVQNHGVVRNWELQFRTKSGRILDTLFSADIIELNGRKCFLAIVSDITERMRIQRELRESQALFQSIIDNTPSAIYVKDRDGKIQVANEALANLLGTTKEAMIGKTSYDFYPREVAEEHIANDLEVLASGTAFDAEEIVPGESGTRTFLSQKFPIKDGAGAFTGVGGISTEITARKQIEEALRASESRLRRLVESNIIGIVYMDDYGRLSEANDYFLGTLGYTRDDIQSERIDSLSLTPPEYALIDQERFEEARIRGACMPYEKEYFRKDGTRLPVVAGYARIEGSSGDYIGFVLDISERKRAESDLADARAIAEQRAAELESLIANLADGVALFDADYRVVSINEAGRRILGLSLTDPLPRWREYSRFTLDGQPIRTEDTPVYRALHGETIRDLRYRTITPEGRELIIGVSASPVLDLSGRIIGATNVFRDQSERVRFEERQRELLLREHRIAKTLQEALVPSDLGSGVPNCRVVARYEAAWDEAQVGGDFYDVFELQGDKVAVLIGDVAGKGLQAAMRVAAARHSVRGFAYMGLGPAEVLSLANESLTKGASETSGMLTLFLAIVDRQAGTMTFANAGHEPPVLIGADGHLEELDSTGLIMGIMEGISYGETTRSLSPEDKLIMFTDGITEARTGSSQLFGKERTLEFLTRNRQLSLNEIVSGLLDEAKKFAQGSLQDDAAIVAFALGSEDTGTANSPL